MNLAAAHWAFLLAVLLALLLAAGAVVAGIVWLARRGNRPPRGRSVDAQARLEALTQLHAKGLIDEREYRRKRAAIIGDL